MIKFRLAHLSIAMAALGFVAATPVIGLSSAVAAEALRAEIGKPLQQAQAQMKQGQAQGCSGDPAWTGQSKQQNRQRKLHDRARPRCGSLVGR